jgi:hypothetical protein
MLAALPFTALLSVVAHGQDTLEAAEPEPAPIQFQALKSWRVDLGDRSVFLNRVAPPVLPAAPVAALQVDARIGQTDAAEAVAVGKKSEVLFLAATVYDHRFTEIRWVGGERGWSAFSNIDFNLFVGAGSFETEDAAYSLLLGVGNATTGAAEAAGGVATLDRTLSAERNRLPPPELLSPARAQYFVVGDGPGAAAPACDLAALDALHRYFDANRQRLADAHAQREAARIEHEQRMKELPPKPRATVVHYWKMDAASIQAVAEGKGK